MTVQYRKFSSSREAKRFFDRNVGKALKVFAQGSKSDSDGKQIG